MSEAIRPAHFPWYDYSRYSFSLGLTTSGGVYLSGQTASRYDADAGRIVVTGGMKEQVGAIYDKVGAVLQAAGLGFGDVVRVVEYLKPEGIERYAEAAAVRAELFAGHAPAVNTVPVRSLVRPDAFIEIELTAAAPGRPHRAAPGLPSAHESGGVVFLPTVLPTDAAGDVVGVGDIAAQTEAIFEKAAGMLKALGLGFDHVVKTVDYLTPAARGDYRRAGPVRKAHLGPVHPASAGILMPRLMHPDALQQYDFIAVRDRPAAVNPGWQRYENLTYSPGVKAGKLLFMSGFTALEPATGKMLHEGDITAQAETAYDSIRQVLEAAGGGLQHLVKTIEYVTPQGLPGYRGVSALRSRLLAEPYPASTGLVCEALLYPELLIEVDPFAILE